MARRSSSFGERRGARQEGAKRGHPSDRAPGGRDWRPGDLITHLGDQHVEPMLVGRALGQGRAGAARNTTPREDRGTGRCIGAREPRRRREPRRGSDRAATTAWRCGRARHRTWAISSLSSAVVSTSASGWCSGPNIDSSFCHHAPCRVDAYDSPRENGHRSIDRRSRRRARRRSDATAKHRRQRTSFVRRRWS